MERLESIVPRVVTDILAKWAERREDWARLRVQVDGAALVGEVIGDLHALTSAVDDELLGTQAAAQAAGYHPDSLLRLMHRGELSNYGTKRRPQFRRNELPRRARIARDGQPISPPDADDIARAALAGRGRSR